MNIVLSGDLNFLNLADLLQLLGTSASTGVLKIKNKAIKHQGIIYLNNGNPMNASAGNLSGLEALYSLFGWIEGQFEFSKENISEANVIKKSRMEIILESLRLLDDGHIKKIGKIEDNLKKDDKNKKSEHIVKGPLIDYMYIVDEEEFHDKQMIVSEGKYGGWMWVIIGGSVDIIKDTPKGPLKIMTIGEGAFIGSVSAFLMKGNIRSATTFATGNVHLGVLDFQRLSVEFSTMSNDFKDFLISIDRRLRQINEHSVDMYLNQDNSEEIIKNNKIIIKKGNEDKKLFSVTQGNAYIVRNDAKTDIVLANLGEKDFYGFIPFLDLGQEPYSASVYGSNTIISKTLDINALNKEFDNLSITFKNIIKHLASCISATTLIASKLKKKG